MFAGTRQLLDSPFLLQILCRFLCQVFAVKWTGRAHDNSDSKAAGHCSSPEPRRQARTETWQEVSDDFLLSGKSNFDNQYHKCAWWIQSKSKASAIRWPRPLKEKSCWSLKVPWLWLLHQNQTNCCFLKRKYVVTIWKIKETCQTIFIFTFFHQAVYNIYEDTRTESF